MDRRILASGVLSALSRNRRATQSASGSPRVGEAEALAAPLEEPWSSIATATFTPRPSRRSIR
jgi:hypothetical protein